MKPEINRQQAIKSFVLRQGRMTPGQSNALEKLWPKYGVSIQSGVIKPSVSFGRDAPLVLEIGFGMGDSLVELAAHNPQTNYVGVEVHQPGVGALLRQMALQSVNNIRVYCADVQAVLSNAIADDSLSAALIFFPDPWPKKRHHKRRLIQKGFIAQLLPKIKTGGLLHIATDWEPYAEHCVAALADFSVLSNQASTGQYMQRPDTRPITKFEKRGKRLGHRVFDLVYRVK